MLRNFLAKAWPYTLTSALTGFLGTLLAVRLIGIASFADYAIDLAKLSVILVLTELIPSSYSIFQQQKDPVFGYDIAAFILVLLLVVPVSVLVAHEAGFFSSFSWFAVAYAGGVVVQRYLDACFQAQGRVSELFAITLTTNIARLAALVGLELLVEEIAPADMIWGAAAAGIISSQTIFFARNPAELVPFLRQGGMSSLRRLWAQRASYFGYYPNIALKRLRDVSMALVCDWFVPSKVEAGKYLLAYRGIDFVVGQLRVVEAFLNNMRIREALSASRSRSLLLSAIIGQVLAATMSMVLVSQTGFNADMVPVAFVGSFFVYPYVLELAARSDAYASFAPSRVTFSLLAFLLGIGIAITASVLFTDLRAIHLVVAPVLGQTLAALSYRLTK